MATVSSIGIVLLGSLPMAELVRRLLVRPFAWLGERLGLKPQSLTGMLVGLVSALPTLSLYQDMDPRGKVLNVAFAVSAAFVLGDHLGFTAGFAPELLLPMIAAKLTGGVAAVAVALALTRRKHHG